MREAAPTPHSPQPAVEGRSNHQNRSIEALQCNPRLYECLPRLAASAERSGEHRCTRSTNCRTRLRIARTPLARPARLTKRASVEAANRCLQLYHQASARVGRLRPLTRPRAVTAQP
eukprot:72549-Prymnesium_polylepis.1